MAGVAQDALFWLADNVEAWRRPALLFFVVVFLVSCWVAFSIIDRWFDE